MQDDESSKIIWMIHENDTFRDAGKGVIAYAYENSEDPGPPEAGWKSGIDSEATTLKVIAGGRALQVDNPQEESTDKNGNSMAQVLHKSVEKSAVG